MLYYPGAESLISEFTQNNKHLYLYLDPNFIENGFALRPKGLMPCSLIFMSALINNPNPLVVGADRSYIYSAWRE